MSGAQATFNTAITATDKTGPVIAKLDANVDKASKHIASLGERASHAFQRMTHQVHHFGEGVKRANEHVEGLFGALRTLSSPIEALAAAGGIGALFEVTANAAETYGKLEHTARIIGLTADQLAKLHYMAGITDTDTGTLDKGLTRFGAHIGGVLTHTDKAAEAWFKHLGIALKDTQGHIPSTANVFDDVRKVFLLNPNASVREKIAQALFGVRATDLADMLGLTNDKMKELSDTFSQIHYEPSETEKFNLGKFKDSWVTMKTAVGELGTAIGSKLAGPLGDVVTMFSNWVGKNKEWISTNIVGWVTFLIDYLKNVDWRGLWNNIQADSDQVFQALKALADGILGIKAAYESLRSLVHPDAAPDRLSVTPPEIDRFLNQQATSKRVPLWMEPDFRGVVMPSLPGAFGLPSDFMLGMPPIGAVPTPTFGFPSMPSLNRWGGPLEAPPAAPVHGEITVTFVGAPPGTTSEVTREGGVLLRTRLNGDTGAGMDRPR